MSGIFVSIAGVYSLFFLVYRKKARNVSVYAAFFVISLACLVLLKYMCVNGAERFHLLFYGILSGILFWALRIDVQNKLIYVYTTILVCLVGAIDEFIQAILPMRCFDMRDIVMNWFSGGLGTLFIVFVLKPVWDTAKGGKGCCLKNPYT
ncbi:membrane protein [Candidatus Kuenenia stuttgartiensis]|uniref:Membrane protein n=1 Tax=Kuenenia stuttgartiensis TaxID=174633 RepID=A0A6G7GUR3_KUEST|nr:MULTISPECIES: VanZ family protein [Kuenenia]MBE7548341.1 VanZ family protein [Planctomycetia bacterium]MBZ0192383.1 VanZ family protein [Candidatus Kuenenia stuttgartiensis]MCF6150813.1 hypothetical protein [Candidatus Kuenenia stuttgartiensis]MCL4726334.1 VanZ family protein [Candidatus Kuenenia stuttgartiensis]MCZ7621000.1 VanZ family protein [Candidatus Kuenenia sp.]